jgi:AcrR family transcriptional regulator
MSDMSGVSDLSDMSGVSDLSEISDTEVRRRPGGRSERVRRSVLDAALEILSEHGADALTVSALATRSGVHETSIYRRWGSRENVVIEALLSTSEELLPIPDTGSLRGDLIAFATSLGTYLGTALGSALVRTLAASATDPAMDETRQRFWETRRALAGEMVTRAIERGEIPATTDPSLALEALIGPLHFRALLTTEPNDEQFTTRLVDMLLDGIGA